MSGEDGVCHILARFTSDTRVVTLLVLMLAPAVAVAACDAAAEGASYEKAVARVNALPEFKAWVAYVSKHPGVRVLTLPAVDKQELIAGRCYWSVSAYSDEGTHLHRWNTFFVSADGKRILVANLDGDRIALSKWRLSEEGKVWRPGG